MSLDEITFKNFNKEIDIEGTITKTSQMLLKRQEGTGKMLDYQEIILQPSKDRRRRLRCILEGGDVGKVRRGDEVNVRGTLDFEMKIPRFQGTPLIPDKNPSIFVSKITIIND